MALRNLVYVHHTEFDRNRNRSGSLGNVTRTCKWTDFMKVFGDFRRASCKIWVCFGTIRAKI